MKACCEITFRRAIEEVLITIDQCKIQSIEKLKETLEYAVKQMKQKELKREQNDKALS